MSDSKTSPQKSTWRNARLLASAFFQRKTVKKYDRSTNQDGESPFIVEFVMVQCIDFVCMAYQDKNEVWRNAYNNDALPEPVRVLG
jgi:hypothetical protein